MQIREVANQTGLDAKTIRYYESIELVSPSRGDNGYRQYGRKELEQLIFIARARRSGFNLDECRQLLAMYKDSHRQSADVHRLVEEKIHALEHRISELQQMHKTLKSMAAQCQADEQAECAIIDALSDMPEVEVEDAS